MLNLKIVFQYRGLLLVFLTLRNLALSLMRNFFLFFSLFFLIDKNTISNNGNAIVFGSPSVTGNGSVDIYKYGEWVINTTNIIGGSWAAQGLARDITLSSVKGVNLNDLKIYG